MIIIDAVDILLRMGLQDNICSSFLAEITGHYKSIVNESSSAWHKLIPQQYKMTSSNCWYAPNLNFKILPSTLFQKVKYFNDNFSDIQHQFKRNEMELILTGILKNSSSRYTGNFFCLPAIFLIGFPKSGTTQLYKYIEQHPLIAKPRDKEGQFWREFVRTNDIQYKELHVLLYLFHFFYASKKIRLNPTKVTIDASASTVFASSRPYVEIEKDMCILPAILHKTLPKSRIMIIMRNPIDRLWSDFWYFCSRSEWMKNEEIIVPGHILPVASEIFHNYTNMAIQKFSNCIDSNHTIFYCTTISSGISGHEAGCNHVRLGLSMYYVHMLRWFSVFPRSQILWIRMEDLISNPLGSMKYVWSFLDMPYIKVVSVNTAKNRNYWIRNSKYRAYFDMWPETRDILEKFFNPYNFKLAELLDDMDYLWNE